MSNTPNPLNNHKSSPKNPTLLAAFSFLKTRGEKEIDYDNLYL